MKKILNIAFVAALALPLFLGGCCGDCGNPTGKMRHEYGGK